MKAWAAHAILTVVVLAAALTQAWGIGHWRGVFAALEVEPWGRFLTAGAELAGLAFYWWPGRRAYGAAILLAVALGAVLAHLVVLGLSSAPPAIVLALIAGAVLNRAQGEFRR